MKNLLREKNGNDFGKAIRKWRISRNLTQEEIGEEIGISREWVSKIECGKSHLNHRDLLIFMKVINFKDIDEFYSFLKEAISDVSVHTR